MLARHAAPCDDGKSAAPVQTLARRAQGRSMWGVLRGDVDNFGVRLRRLHTIEEHVQLSVLYKQFFAGELEVLCSLPEFWRKVSIIYSGGDDFAVYGSWDALIALAREMQRLFHRFTEENLKDFPGAEGKTISMAHGAGAGAALSAGGGVSRRPAAIWTWRNRRTRIASTCSGRMLEWRQLGRCGRAEGHRDAADADFRMSRQFLYRAAQLLPRGSVRHAGTEGADRSAPGVFNGGSTGS